MRGPAWPAEAFPPWLTALVLIGLADLGCDVVADASQNIMSPRARTRNPTRVMIRKDMGLSPIVNSLQIQYANR